MVAARALAVLAPWEHSLSVVTLALVLVTWTIVERVKFPVASAWTYPTMLVFVPALFMLPTPIVPLVALVAILLRRGPRAVPRPGESHGCCRCSSPTPGSRSARCS